MISLLALLACGPPEPVVRAVKPVPTIEEVRAKREAEELRASPQVLEVGYTKPAGVYIDVAFLGGRRYDHVRAEVEDQFGVVKEEIDTALAEKEIRFQRGTLRTDSGVIVSFEIPLPELVRRSEALASLGFPAADAGRYTDLTFEFRLNNLRGFRRIIFHRAERGGELIDRISAYFKDPE